MSKLFLPRRTFLRGLGGTAVAVPLLDVMLDGNGEALASSADIPCRYVLTFAGTSLGADGDSSPNGVIPDTDGANFDPAAHHKSGLLPLVELGVENEVTVISGLRIPAGGAPGGRAAGDSFHWHVNPMLTGNTQVGGAFSATVTADTTDQVVARAIAGDTTFESLHLRVQALYYTVPGGVDVPDNREGLSFRDVGGGDVQFVPPYTSPRQAYDALFTNFMPGDPEQAALAAQRLAQRKSVLDVVDRRMAGLLPRLGAADQLRLQRHYDEIRDLERRLDAMPPDQVGACDLPPDPGADPPLGGEPPSPNSYDVNAGYSGEEERAVVMTDILHMALTCDLTRSATLMYTMWQSFMNINDLPGVGIQNQSHLVQHNGSNGQMTNLCRWYSHHYGRLVQKLRDTPEGSGSVLDHCAVIFLFEGGHGGDPEFGQAWSSHTTENMVAMMAGRAGGMVPGQHIVAPASSNHPMNVMISGMNAVGVTTQSQGDVSGTIPGVFGS